MIQKYFSINSNYFIFQFYCYNLLLIKIQKMDKTLEQFIHKNYNIIIEKQIGQGLTSKIYLCQPLNSLRKKAIKLYTFPEQILHEQNAVFETKKKERLALQYQFECKILELLKNKQNIVHAECSGEFEKYGFIIMQYLQMRSLRDVHNMLIEKRDRSGQNTSFKDQCKKIIKILLLKLLEGLKTLSQNGIIHRDVKLQNILFNSAYTLKIIDFGSAKMISGCHTNVLTPKQLELINKIIQLDEKLNSANDFIVGSVNYLCPDPLAPKSHRIICSKIDVWAFGILMYYLMYDTYPFHHHHESSLTMIIKTIKTVQPEYPETNKASEQQKQIIKRCLQKDVRKRISIEQLLETSYFKEIKKSIEKDTLKKNLERYEFPQKFQKKLLFTFQWDNIQCWIEDHIHRQNEEQIENASKKIKKYKNIKIYIIQNQYSQRLLCTKSRKSLNHQKQSKQEFHQNDDSDEQVYKLKKEYMNIKIPLQKIHIQHCKNNTLVFTYQINNKQPNVKSLKFIFNSNQPLQELVTTIAQLNSKKTQLSS